MVRRRHYLMGNLVRYRPEPVLAIRNVVGPKHLDFIRPAKLALQKSGLNLQLDTPGFVQLCRFLLRVQLRFARLEPIKHISKPKILPDSLAFTRSPVRIKPFQHLAQLAGIHAKLNGQTAYGPLSGLYCHFLANLANILAIELCILRIIII